MKKLSDPKNKAITLLFLIMTGLLLTYPKESLALSLTGLQLWFNRMVPTLLPFMILSGIMIRLNLTEHIVKIISPVLTPLLRISLNGLYAVAIGFLCGFPMGARVIAELYENHKLSKEEASYLLAFCNNIGPVYFISFVLPTDCPLSFWHVWSSFGLRYFFKIYFLQKPHPHVLLYTAIPQAKAYPVRCGKKIPGILAGYFGRFHPVRPIRHIQIRGIYGFFQSSQPGSADIVRNHRFHKL